jgi:hypothetical protein
MVRLNSTGGSDQHAASVFNFEERTKQETSVKAGGKLRYSPETSVGFQRNTRHYIQKIKTLL